MFFNKIFKAKFPQTYSKIQRRELLRAELPLIAQVEYTTNNETKTSETKIIDISGSGISFNIDDNLSEYNKITITFNLEETIIKTPIKIIEIRKNLRENIEKYRISAQFVSLNNHEIEHIIKHCIKHQIKTIKKYKEGK